MVLEHPLLGSVETYVGDVSDGGLFVVLPDSGLHRGARLRLTPQAGDTARHRHAPTLLVEVRHVTPTGVGIGFANAGAERLWQQWRAVEPAAPPSPDVRHRVYLALVARGPDGGVLVARSDRRWQLPAIRLDHRSDWRGGVAELVRTLGLGPQALEAPEVLELLEPDAAPGAPDDHGADAPSRLHVLVGVRARPDLPRAGTAGYEEFRWLASVRPARELSFAHPAEQAWLVARLDREGTPR